MTVSYRTLTNIIISPRMEGVCNVLLSKNLLIITLIVGFFCHGSVKAEITVEPFGFAVSVEEDGEAEIELVLSNSGDDNVAFSIDYELVEYEDDRQSGPRRDDLGDVLETFELPYLRILGYAWDGECMWGVGYNDNRLICIDPEDDFEVIHDFAVNAPCVGMTWDSEDEVFWLGVWNSTNVLIYDREGDHISTINMANRTNGAFAYDGEFFYWYSRDLNQIRKLDRNLRNVGQIGNFAQAAANGQDIRGMAYVAEHDEGHFWLQTNERRCIQVNIDFENNRINQICSFNSRGAAHDGIAHDGRNLWTSGLDGEREGVIYDDGVREFDMLAVEPDDGVISAEDSETVTITVTSEGYEAGVYNVLIEIKLTEPEDERDDLEQTLIRISGVVTVGNPAFDITGTVTDAADDALIEGAFIELDRYIIGVHSDDEGNYTLSDLPPGDYELTFTATDYLPTTEDVNIEDEEIELNVSLLQSECTPSRDEFFIELEQEMEQEFEFEITNGGNGPLTYSIERRLLNQVDAERWELRECEDAEDIVRDDALNGVIFIYDHFFVTGGNNGEDVNKIYKINTNGVLVDEFDQFAESRYGMRDLAFDGNLIWGADDGVLYGFWSVGELRSEFNCPVDIECRSLAWDPDREVLWASDISSDIYAIDLEGELVETLERPEELRIYGLAYWSDDPDGYCLYVFCRGEDTDLQVNKINLDNGDFMFAADLDIDGGRPGGIQINGQLDPYSWVLIGMVQNPDRLAVWQLEPRMDWFWVEPEEGLIEAEESEDFVLTVGAEDLVPDNTFEGEVVFTHDGVGGETCLNVQLEVYAGEVGFRCLPMHIGWNLVSLNVQPDDAEDEDGLERLLSDLVEENLLIIMKDSYGHFYSPEYNYNDIPGWNVDQGYQILMSGEGYLPLTDYEYVQRDTPIMLEEGWQIVSYYPRFPIEATVALSGIENHLIIAKDGRGNFYFPDWDFSNMGDMCEGQGYYLNVDEDIELVYQTGEEANALSGGMRQLSVYDTPGRLPVHAVTGENMSLLVIESAPLLLQERTSIPPMLLHERTSIPPLLLQGGSKGGSEIGVYASGELVGSGVLQDGICGIAVWGDDPATEKIDGAINGQSLEIRLYQNDLLKVANYTVLAGESVYTTDGFLVVRLNESPELPGKFEITSAYPNPFNDITVIRYNTLKAGSVKLTIHDLQGRVIDTVFDGYTLSGNHHAVWDASGFPTGLYLCRLEGEGKTRTVKLELIR